MPQIRREFLVKENVLAGQGFAPKIYLREMTTRGLRDQARLLYDGSFKKSFHFTQFHNDIPFFI